MTSPSLRPDTSVIVPFGGSEDEALKLTFALGALDLREQDRLIIVDNTVVGLAPSVVAQLQGALRAQVVRAAAQRSSYYSRNVGADIAESEWLLFIDADCVPRQHLIAHYFAAPIASDCGAVAGEVEAVLRATNVYVRYAISRAYLRQDVSLATPGRPFVVTANLLVRRRVWREIGGFCEGVVSAADQDFSWRLQEAGWNIAYRPNAIVEHEHRAQLRAFLSLWVKYGRGRAWLNRRRPSAWPRPKPGKALAIGVRGLIFRLVRGELDEAVFRVLDVFSEFAAVAGYLRSNRPASRSSVLGNATHALVAHEFPTDTVDEMPVTLHIEALRRSQAPRPWLVRELSVAYAEDDGFLEQLTALARLLRADLTSLGALRGNGAHLRPGALLSVAPAAYRLRQFRSVTRDTAPADRNAELDLVLLLSGRSPTKASDQTSTPSTCVF